MKLLERLDCLEHRSPHIMAPRTYDHDTSNKRRDQWMACARVRVDFVSFPLRYLTSVCHNVELVVFHVLCSLVPQKASKREREYDETDDKILTS